MNLEDESRKDHPVKKSISEYQRFVVVVSAVLPLVYCVAVSAAARDLSTTDKTATAVIEDTIVSREVV